MKKIVLIHLFFVLFFFTLKAQTIEVNDVNIFTFSKNDTLYFDLVVADSDIDSYAYGQVKYYKARRCGDTIEILVKKRKSNDEIIKEDIEYQKNLLKYIEDIHNGIKNKINIKKQSIYKLEWVVFDSKKNKIIMIHE